MLVLTGTPRHVELPTSTVIVTSGHGGVFPRGIPIGRVTGPEGLDTSWQRNYLIRPSVSPSEMTYVLVLGAPQEVLSGVDLARSWGIRPEESMAVDTAAARAAAAAAAGAGGAQRSVTPSTTTSPPAGPPLLGVPVGEATDGAN